jgi:DNA-binding CsgD family transcriptional regulator
MDRSPILETFLPVYMVVLIGVIIYDVYSVHAAFNLEADNHNLRHEISAVYHDTGLNSESIRAITQLCREKGKAEGMREILSRMDPSVKARLVNGLAAIRQEDESSRKNISAAFPMLTPMQVTICQMVLQDMKLTEICRITGKSEGNITSQRSRIRAILELKSDEVLKDVLQERLKAYIEASK